MYIISHSRYTKSVDGTGVFEWINKKPKLLIRKKEKPEMAERK